MEVKIVKDSISKKELVDIAKIQFGDLVKAVVDIEQGIMAVGCEMHAVWRNGTNGTGGFKTRIYLGH